MKKILVTIFVLFWATSVLAHRISLFAYTDGNEIEGEVYFVDGSPVKKAQVELLNPQGKVLASTLTDERGQFRFGNLPPVETVRLVAVAEAGHRAEMTLKLKKTAAKEAAQENPSLETNPPQSTSLSPEEVAQLVRTEIQRELEPVKGLLEEILKELQKPSFHEIVSGLGYIVGLFGLFLWLKARR